MVIEGVRREVKMTGYRLLDLLVGSVVVQIEHSQGQLFAASVDTNVNNVIYELCHSYTSSWLVDYYLQVCFLSINVCVVNIPNVSHPCQIFFIGIFACCDNSPQSTPMLLLPLCVMLS